MRPILDNLFKASFARYDPMITPKACGKPAKEKIDMIATGSPDHEVENVAIIASAATIIAP